MGVTEFVEKSEFDAFLAANPLVAVDFSAAWCGPCKMIGPKFVEMSDKFPTIKFVKIDVDEASEISEACKISAMPTFIFYKNGQKFDEFKGASEEKLEGCLQKLAA